MQRQFIMNVMLFIAIACLSGCVVQNKLQLKSGEYFFEKGYYKRAMQDLLPAAEFGNARAQYAVGYMYYYGYGVPQNTDKGYYWIEKAARCHHPKAIVALQLIHEERNRPKRITYRRYLK